MAVVYASPEDVCNAALAKIGYPKRIAQMFDGTRHAEAALQIYGELRDEKLRGFEWGFAERNTALTLLKTAPANGYSVATPWTAANPLPPWIYEYAYPDDMLLLRSLRGAFAVVPNFDPKPKLWRIANDTVANVQRKVILCNLGNAIAVYTGQVVDPALWEPMFTGVLVDAIAERLVSLLPKEKAAPENPQGEILEAAAAEQRVG